MTSSWERNRRVIVASFVLEAMAFKLVSPFIPLYLPSLGVTDPSAVPLWAGATLGVTSLGVASLLPLWNRLARRTGRKVQVMRALAGCAIGLALSGLAQTALQLFLAFAVEGMMAGFYPQIWTLASTGAPPGGVAEALGLLQGVGLMVDAVGPFVGGLLGDLVGFNPGYWIGAGFCAAAFLLILLGYREIPEEEKPPPPPDAPRPHPGFRTLLGAVRQGLAVPGMAPLMAMAFLYVCLVPSVSPLVPLHLQRLSGPGAAVATLSGVALAMANVAAALAAFLTGRLTRRWPARPLAVAALVAGGAVTALVPMLPWVEAAFGLWIVRSALVGGVITLLYAMADGCLPESAVKPTYANMTVAMMFGFAAGPMLTGALAAADLRGAFAAVGAGLVGMGIWVARAFRSSPETRQGF